MPALSDTLPRTRHARSQLVTLKPDSPAAYATLGEAQMGLEQYTEALRYFERARVLVARGKLGSEMEQARAAARGCAHLA